MRFEADLGDCQEQLANLSGGIDPDRFAEEVEQADADALGPMIDDLDTALEQLRTQWQGLNQTIGAERTVLEGMNGADRAAEAAERVQTTLTRLQTDVQRYAALRIAATVLQRGIERYRDQNQGPVLARASLLFRDLTGGAFRALQIDDDGAGAVLKGVRPDGRPVPVAGMSDGSHDQLYLALRLASLGAWIDAHEPIPFVVDDILLNFDDVRALAALRALADLSARTQVLFFTHHRHLVEMARDNLAEEVVFLHELSGRRPGSKTGHPLVLRG